MSWCFTAVIYTWTAFTDRNQNSHIFKWSLVEILHPGFFFFFFTVKPYYSRPNLNVLTVSRVWWLYHQTKQWQFPQNQTVNTGRICLENNNKCIRGWLLSSPLSWMHLKIHLIVTVLQPTGSKEIESGGHFLSWTKLKEISDVIQADGETLTGGSPEFTEKTCQRASSWV